MKKPTQFLFAAAIVAIMLFVLGAWVASARATGAGSIDTTPAPTIMPTETSMGESPSTEEQEALKAIVQAYIEIRYHALSVTLRVACLPGR